MPGLQVLQDKNPGSEAKCKEALIKLQQGREQAGTQMDNANRGFDSPTSIVLLGGALRNDFSIFQSEAQGKQRSLCRIDICFTQRICSRLLDTHLVLDVSSNGAMKPLELEGGTH